MKREIDSCNNCPVEKKLVDIKESNDDVRKNKPVYECVLSGLQVELCGPIPNKCPLVLMYIQNDGGCKKV